MTKYERTVAAALKEGNAGLEVAEALAIEIPRIGKGNSQENGTLTRSLEEVAMEIEDAGGKLYAVSTLRGRRLAALWVADNTKSVHTDFGWREGSSLSAHVRAAEARLDWAEWSKLPRTHSDTMRMAGQKTYGDTDVEKLDSMEQADALNTLVDMNPELVIAAAEKAHAKRIVQEAEHITRTATPTKEAPTPNKVKVQHLLGEMQREVRLQRKFMPRMTRTGDELDSFMSDDDKRAYTNMVEELGAINADMRKATSDMG